MVKIIYCGMTQPKEIIDVDEGWAERLIETGAYKYFKEQNNGNSSSISSSGTKSNTEPTKKDRRGKIK